MSSDEGWAEEEEAHKRLDKSFIDESYKAYDDIGPIDWDVYDDPERFTPEQILALQNEVVGQAGEISMLNIVLNRHVAMVEERDARIEALEAALFAVSAQMIREGFVEHDSQYGWVYHSEDVPLEVESEFLDWANRELRTDEMGTHTDHDLI